MFRLSRIWFASVALLCTLAAFAGTVRADQATSALTKASKLLEQGVHLKAIELINETIKSGQLPSDLAAKALLMRAVAHEKLGKYAYALADYNQAAFQGLSDYDKTKAQQGRKRIMAKLGVGASSKSSEAAASSTINTAAWDTAEVRTAPSEERTGGILASLFGSSEPEARTRQQQPTVQRQDARPVNTAIRKSPTQPSREQPDPIRVASRTAEQDGDFAIQMAALRSEDSAIYEVNRIEKRYGEWLGGRTPSITIRATSDGGTLYKVIAEPFEHGEGVAICELLKTKGLSCMLISR